MKNKYLIIALSFLGTGLAFSQTKPFEGKVTSTIQVGRGSKTESVDFYKNGNAVYDIAYMKTKMLDKDGISYYTRTKTSSSYICVAPTNFGQVTKVC